jgi:hypothetical protein
MQCNENIGEKLQFSVVTSDKSSPWLPKPGKFKSLNQASRCPECGKMLQYYYKKSQKPFSSGVCKLTGFAATSH